jgi:hypothetical protein
MASAQVLLAANNNELSWVAPVMRVDGAPFNIVEEQGYYTLTWTRGAQTGNIRVPADATTYDISVFKANTTFSMVACDDLDVCSAISNTVKKPGGPPVAVTLEIK